MVELLCGIFVLLFIVLLLFDLTILLEAVNMNNSICREAARAAASGAPDALSHGAPLQRAEAIVQKYAKDSGMMRFRPVCVVKENLSLPLPTPPLGGAVVGQVTVETVVNIELPFNPWPLPHEGYSFTARQTYPYTYTVAATVK
jgi:Flp pilus assembly protein TadG